MNAPNWQELIKDKDVLAQPEGVWQDTTVWIQGPVLLKVEANAATWNYLPSSSVAPCSANGDPLSALDPKRCIIDKAPVGALIGKIGGSSVDRDVTAVFAVGRFCVRRIDSATRGPLFLTINDAWNGFGDNSGKIAVTISIAQDPA